MVINIPADRKIGETSIEEVRVRPAHFLATCRVEDLNVSWVIGQCQHYISVGLSGGLLLSVQFL
jgi:hypothetical protein